ncbi:MAG: hypothetical protein ACYCWW_06745 [Deltaproteobacteria bacterium]
MAGSDRKAKVEQRQRARLEKLLSGVPAWLELTGPLQVGGTSYSGPQLAARLKALLSPHLALDAAVEAAKLSVGKAREALSQHVQATGREVEQLRGLLRVKLMDQPAALVALGLASRLPRKPKVETLLAAQRSKRETRAVRHTLGKRQREAIRPPLK